MYTNISNKKNELEPLSVNWAKQRTMCKERSERFFRESLNIIRSIFFLVRPRAGNVRHPPLWTSHTPNDGFPISTLHAAACVTKILHKCFPQRCLIVSLLAWWFFSGYLDGPGTTSACLQLGLGWGKHRSALEIYVYSTSRLIIFILLFVCFFFCFLLFLFPFIIFLFFGLSLFYFLVIGVGLAQRPPLLHLLRYAGRRSCPALIFDHMISSDLFHGFKKLY